MSSHLRSSRSWAARSLGFAGLLVAFSQAMPWTAAQAATDSAATSASTPAPSPPPPQAPSLAETLTVSATTAEEGRAPVSFVTLSREQLAERHHGQDLAMLLADTPNAYAYSDAGNGVGYAYFSLRGFDQRRVAVYLNGVPLNEPESQQVYFVDLADLASQLDELQVQRGTGTALYGSPAVGGVVSLEFGTAAARRAGTLMLAAGSFGTRRVSARANLPLRGSSVLIAQLGHVRSDGYRQPAETRHTLARLSFQHVGASSVWRVHAFGGPERTQLAYLGVPIEFLRGQVSGDVERDRRVNPLRPGELDHFVQPHVQILYDRQLGQRWLLKSALYSVWGEGYFLQFNDSLSYDPLGSATPSPAFPELNLVDTWRRRAIHNQRLGFIPSLQWRHDGGRLDIGLDLQRHRGRHEGLVRAGFLCAPADAADAACAARGPALAAPLRLYDFTNGKERAGLFARESLELGPRLSLGLEASLVHQRFALRDDRVRGYAYDTSYTFFTPRLGLRYAASARLALHASLSTARSEPRFADVWDVEDPFANPLALFERADPAARRFESARARPERLRAAELGASWSGARLRLEANAYWMDFRDELVFAGGIDDDGLPITDNAARSLHRGIELRARLHLPGDVHLDGHVAASHDVLRDYTLRYGPSATDTLDYSGNRIALFPTHQARLRLTRQFGNLRATLGLKRVGTLYLDNSQDERKDPAARQVPGYVSKRIAPYTLGDAQLTWTWGAGRSGARWPSLGVQIENLFDRRYVASGYVYGTPSFYPAATRQVHASLNWSF
jgi:iron complex outermembrane receptor protein